MDDAYYDRMAKETDEFHAAVYETHEDGGNEVSTEPCSQFDDIPADIDDNTLTDSETHLRIPNPLVSQSLFGNFIEIEPDFELTDARNTEKPTKGVGISPDVSDCPDELTATVQLPGAPIMFDAGAIAYGPWTIDDLYRRDHMMQRIPTGFRDIGHYEFAEFLVKCKLPVDHINELLGSAGWINPEIRSSFHSHHTMMNRLKQLQVDLEMVEWERIELNERWPGIDLPVVVYRRNPAALVQVLLSQQTFVDDAVYGAVRQMEDGDRRVWGEMNTGDWWADQQVSTPLPAPQLALILTIFVV